MSKKSSKKALLAYSGGLDTSFCILYLKNKGYEVHTAFVDTGGFSQNELKEIEEKARSFGAKTCKILDVKDAYYKDCIKYLIFGNVLKNNTYPLSVSAERIFQAKALATYANKIGADAIAHGCTGAGNDQVRFDLTFSVFCPEKEIISPIRDLNISREQELKYIEEQGFSYPQKQSTYSVNKGMWGTSVGGKETLTSDRALPAEAFPAPISKNEPSDHVLLFEKGEIIGIDNFVGSPVEVIQKIESYASQYGIGRDTHVGDTILGIKGRVGFQAAAAHTIIEAHRLLEKHTLTKWQLYWKDILSNTYGNLLHDGLFMEPLMRNIEKLFSDSQERVSGKVFIQFLPQRLELKGIESAYDLMRVEDGTYGEKNNAWTADDVKGFIKIYSNQMNIYHRLGNEKN